MKKYEIMLIAKSTLGDAKAKEFSETLKSLITSFGGSVSKEDFWGKRKFSYPIKHETEGYYYVNEFEMDSPELLKFKNKLNLLTEQVRYLITAKS